MSDFTGEAVCTCGRKMDGAGGQSGPTGSYAFRNCVCGIKAVFYTVPSSHDFVFRTQRKGIEHIKEEERNKLLQCFNLAEIKVNKFYMIANQYSGTEADWILAMTELGNIVIGWRKRVISIDWSDTGIKMIVPDDVTKEENFCHAWSYGKAVDYLEQLKCNSELVSNQNG